MSKSNKLKRPSDREIKPDAIETKDSKKYKPSDRKSPYFKKDTKAEKLEASSSDDDAGDDSTPSLKRHPRTFYQKSCVQLAKALLGQVLVRMYNGVRISGRIVETEAYLGLKDPSAHSFKGKTDRCTAMFMAPGTSYVYDIHACSCMNISSEGEGEAVLIRALEPLDGKDVMATPRLANRKKPSDKPMKDKDLCNGPGNLTQALHISKVGMNKVDLTLSDTIWVERGQRVPDSRIVVSKRIGIECEQEWKDKPLRFYELGNINVSKRDKEAENEKLAPT